jgi:hypothetical protein
MHVTARVQKRGGSSYAVFGDRNQVWKLGKSHEFASQIAPLSTRTPSGSGKPVSKLANHIIVLV